MKKPPTRDEINEEHGSQQQQSSSGAIARVRRFFSMSFSQKRIPRTPPMHSVSYTTPPHYLLRNLKHEADKILSRPLDEVMLHQDKQPHGVPVLVHNLCLHLINNGMDYDTLVSDNWNRSDIKNWLKQIEIDSPGNRLQLADEDTLGPSKVAGLLRLFLTELPHPILTKSVASAIFRLYKDQFTRDNMTGLDRRSESRAIEVRSVLSTRLPENNLRLLIYLCSFLHQMQNSYPGSNHSLCETSKVLGRILCDLSTKNYTGGVSYRLAYLLMQDYDHIFAQPLTPSDDGEYNSEDTSSAGDSKSDNTDPETFGQDKNADDDSTTTSDTDDFRSLPISPLREPAWAQTSRSLAVGGTKTPVGDSSVLYGTTSAYRPTASSVLHKVTAGSTHFTSKLVCDTLHLSPILGLKRKEHADDGCEEHDPKSLRSTREATEIGRGRKISNLNKDKIRSITDLLSSPDDSSRDEGTRLNHLDRPWTQFANESCVSGGEDSDGLESETARDADRSDTEGVMQDEMHDERRFSDSFYSSNRKGSSSEKKSRRKIRRKNSKDLGTYEASSEEEEETDRNDNYSINANDEEPRQSEGSLAFRDLLASNEPVTSDRASWGSKMYDIDETHRTAPRYSRFEDNNTNKGSWYQDLDSPESGQRQDNADASHPAIKVLMRSISSVKKQIRKFEKEFESNNGYKPSHSDKMKNTHIKDLMSEMKEMRRELKQLKDDVTGFIMPKRLRTQDTGCEVAPSAQLMKQIEESLRQKRSKSHRPQELPAMATEDLKDEKANLQEALLYYERSCGRPISHEDKSHAKHLYKRYRAVKQRLSAGDSSPELIPIVENVETVFLETASPLHRGSLQTEDDIKLQESMLRTHPMNEDPHPGETPGGFNLADLHSLPVHELRNRKKIAKESKKTLKRSLRKWELNFENTTGRKVSKDDRGPMDKVYGEYKLAKAKLKLLNALLSKAELRNI